MILKHAEIINELFGSYTVNNIIDTMESKTKKAKELKEEKIKEEQLAIQT